MPGRAILSMRAGCWRGVEPACASTRCSFSPENLLTAGSSITSYSILQPVRLSYEYESRGSALRELYQ